MPNRIQPGNPGPLPWRLLVAAVAPSGDRRAILDDLTEEYQERIAPDGRAAARWYRQQVLRSLPWLLSRRLHLLARNFSPASLREILVSIFIHDVRSGIRSLMGAPLLSGLVVAVLALGIAANTAIFSLINPILLRTLPYQEPERLVHMFESDPSIGSFGWDMMRQSLPTLDAWRAASSFEEVAAYVYMPVALRSPQGEARSVDTGYVTANLFAMLGVEPAIGRNFSAAEDVPGDNQVVLLSDAVWQGQFGADPEIVGASVFVDGIPHVVVGVMQPGFNFPFGEIRMWKPAAFDAERWGPDRQSILTLGRLREGVSREAAQAELSTIHDRLEGEYPEQLEGHGVRVIELRRALVFFHDQLRAMMLALLVASGMVLLIVCANVANLMLAWSGSRRHDIAIRAAIGAGRGRIVRQLLTENSLLAVAAAIAGVILARAGIGAVGPVVPQALYRVGEIEIDGAAILFTGVLAVVTALAFGLAPALRAARVSLTETLKDSRPGASGVARRFSRALVFAQVAVATFLCGGAAIAIGLVQEFSGAELGFDPTDVVAIQVTLPNSDYPAADEVLAFQDQARAVIGVQPGVASVGWIDMLPLDFASGSTTYRLPEEPADGDAAPHRADLSAVTPQYFDSMRIALLQGRDFDLRDGRDGAPVVIVNDLLASSVWPEGTPVGKVLTVEIGNEDRQATVVGVVANSLGGIALTGMSPQVFVPTAQRTLRGGFLTVRARGTRAEVIDAARAALARLDGNLPVENVRAMETVVEQAFEPVVATGNLLSGFGVFALVLAGLGVYGVAAHAVSQRTHEIGVRMAIGASTRNIMGVVMRTAAGTVAVGAVVGVLAIFALQIGLSSALGESLGSPAAPLGVGLLLMFVAAIASWVPARRATRVDPLLALRSE